VSATVPGLGRRREAREEALAVLYEAAMSSSDVASRLASHKIAPDPYAVEIASGVDESRSEIDRLISGNLKGWRIGRMAPIDRIIASMATWELTCRPDVPTGVILSEAVELAAQYSGEESPRFLNGLLRAVADEVRED